MEGIVPLTSKFPKAIDYHKVNRPRVPNALGVIYVFVSVSYLFLLSTPIFDAEGALALASCILFGGFLGLFDDLVNLRWRYKAFLPLFASLPLIALRQGETKMATYIFGKVDFGIWFYILIIPLVLTVTTNVVNQLGGLNGLETICPSIIMVGLMLASPERILLYVPIIVYLTLAFFNYKGKIFVGNTGTFAAGITLASFAIIGNVEQTLFISISPYIFNSTLILLNYFLFRRTAHLMLDENNKLYSNHRRSLLTFIAYNHKLTEHQIVHRISFLFVVSTVLAFLIQRASS